MDKSVDPNFVRCINIKTGEIAYNNKTYALNRSWQNNTGFIPQAAPVIIKEHTPMYSVPVITEPVPVVIVVEEIFQPVDFSDVSHETIKEEKINDRTNNAPAKRGRPFKNSQSY